MDSFNNYQLIREVHSGANSTIYLAINKITQNPFAIKIYHKDFLTETRINSLRNNVINSIYESIDHENINQCIDLLFQEDGIAVTSAYLVGKNLNELIHERERLTINEVTQLMNQIIDAFIQAHNKGVIHGRLNPSDIFIQENGNLKILGFEESVIFGLNHFASLKNQGARCFITPEEIQDGPNAIDTQTDIYLVGLILFYALTGFKPNFYCGFNFSEGFCFNPFPTYEFSESEKKFQAIIEKACHLKKSDRYQSFEILKKEIDS